MEIAEFEPRVQQIKNLQEQGKYQQALIEAGDLYDQIEEECGRYHPHTLQQLLEMGKILIALKEYRAATDTLVECRTRFSAALFPEHPLAVSLNRALAALYSAQELHYEASAFLRLCLEHTVQQDSIEAAEFIDDCLVLSELFQKMGDSGMSCDVLLHAIEFTEQREDIPDTETSRLRMALASLYRATGILEEAAPLLQNALSSLGDSDPARAILILKQLCEIYLELELAEDRYLCLQQLVQLLELSEKEEKTELVSYLLDIGKLSIAFEEFEAAEEAFQKAVVLQKGSKNKKSSVAKEQIDIALGFAALFFAQGKYEESFEALKKALGKSKKLLGEESSEVADILHNLGATALAQDKAKISRKYFEQSCSIRGQLFGENDVSTLESEFGIAMADKHLENRDAAHTRLKECCERAMDALGEEAPLTVGYQNALAEMEKSSEQKSSSGEKTSPKKEEKSDESSSDNVEVNSQGISNEDEKRLSNLFNTAVLEMSNKDYLSAAKLLSEMLELMEQKVGQDSTELAPILMYLAEANEALGKSSEATTLKERAESLSEN